jgi:hypothetical protein
MNVSIIEYRTIMFLQIRIFFFVILLQLYLLLTDFNFDDYYFRILEMIYKRISKNNLSFTLI